MCNVSSLMRKLLPHRPCERGPGCRLRFRAYASDVSVDDMRKSIDSVIESVDKLKEIMTPEEQDVLIAIFSSVASIGTTVVGVIDGCTSFLKLIGAMKDANMKALANITRQLTNITEKISDMDRKLDDISEELARMQANDEVYERADTASKMLTVWYNFEHDYMESSMDELMNNYDSMMLNHIRDWIEFKKEGARQSGTDNVRTDMVIAYYKAQLKTNVDDPLNDGVEHSLIDSVFTPITANNIEPDIYKSQVDWPDPFTMYADDINQTYDKFLILDDTFLPESGKIRWNVNTYRDDLKTFFKDKLNALRESAQAGSVDESHVKEYNMDIQNWSDDDIDTYADGIVDSLMYRVNYLMVNESADFAKDVQKQFGEYCKHLTNPQQGIDAMLKTIYLTHAFEFETKDDISAFCNQMILRTGVYAMFAANIIGMSEYITDDKKQETANSMCEAIDSVERSLNNGITGNDNYCYVTNSILNYADITFSGQVDVEYYTRGAVSGYESYSASSLKTSFSSDAGLGVNAALVGDTNALVIGYLLQNNGIAMNHEFLNEHFTETKRTKKSTLVTSLVGEQQMTTDTALAMKTHKVIGHYFSGDPVINIGSLPSSAEQDYLVYRKKMTGSTLDTDTLTLKKNQALIGTAAYGESHIFWETDEAAAMGGPSNDPAFEETFSVVKTDDGLFTDTWKALYRNSVAYNCLLQIPLDTVSVGMGPFPLDELEQLTAEIEALVQAKSNLKDAIKSAEGTSTANWTDESVENFQKLIAEAKELAESKDASLKELTRTANQLTEAKAYYESIAKKPQSMKVSTTKKTVKAKTLKKAKKVVKAIKVTGAQGTVTYKKVSVNKKKLAKKFAVNKKTGKITLKKGLKKGVYKLRVKVSAAGNDSFLPAEKTVTVRIKVK